MRDAAQTRERDLHDNCATTRETALAAATAASDATGLPQTVIRNADTCGWWHTHSLARSIERSELLVTMLPSRYFS